MLRGVAGYMADYMEEVGRLNKVFQGGLICSHGIPILNGGVRDSTLIRAILELSEWLKISGEIYPQKTWTTVSSMILLEKCNGSFLTETFRHPMPIRGTFVTRSWVSGGWASPSGVQPCSPENEKNIVQTLCREINCVFNAGLCTEPVMDTVPSVEAEEGRKPKFLVIGGSHAIQEAEVLAAKGYDVVTSAASGWRANKTASEEMAVKVQEALKDFCEDDVVVVHCCDNTAFMARTEDGGDLPIRRVLPGDLNVELGDYHVEGDLVVASKERQYMFFKNCLPFLTLLAGRLVVFLTPMPRYLYISCCDDTEHAPNRREAGFEDELRKALADSRDYYKNFLFTSGLRGFSIRNPGLCVPEADESGVRLWNNDPVHPTYAGYVRIVDMICEEADRLRKKPGSAAGGKRAGGSLGPVSKKARMDVPRPHWVAESCAATSRQDGSLRGMDRGRANNRGRGWFRGRGDGRGRGRGGKFDRGSGYAYY
jgi:hypothetical protein